MNHPITTRSLRTISRSLSSLLTLTLLLSTLPFNHGHDTDDSMASYMVTFRVRGAVTQSGWDAMDTLFQAQLGAPTMLNIYSPRLFPRIKLVNFDDSTKSYNASTGTLLNLVFRPCEVTDGCAGNATSIHGSEEFMTLFTNVATEAGGRLEPPVIQNTEKSNRFWNLSCMAQVDRSYTPTQRSDVTCIIVLGVTATATCADEEFDHASELFTKLLIILIIFIGVILLTAIILIIGSFVVDRKLNRDHAGPVPSASNLHEQLQDEDEEEHDPHPQAIHLEMEEMDRSGGISSNSRDGQRYDDGPDIEMLEEPGRTRHDTLKQEKTVLRNLGTALSDEQEGSEDDEDESIVGLNL